MKQLLFSIAISIVCISCEDPKMKKFEAKLEDSKCKSAFTKELLENGINTMLLAQEQGYKAELESFQKLQNDTSINCEELKAEWRKLSEKISR
jgi:hypothetical protein